MKLNQLNILLVFTLLLGGILNFSAQAQSDLTPPPYLLADVDGTTVDLSWGMDGDNGEWISHMETASDFAMPYATFGTLLFAHRWTADMLEPFVGQEVTKIAFIPRSDPTMTIYTLKIWSGQNAQNEAYSQLADDLFYSRSANYWNEVPLDEPFIIESGTDYWFGFERELTQNDNQYSAGKSEEEAFAGYGDMANWGNGWFALSSNGANTDRNWAIQVFLDGEKSLNYKAQRAELLGFNLYRDGELLNDELLTSSVYTDAGLENGTYNYEVKAVYDEGDSSGKSAEVQIGGPTFTFDITAISDSIDAGDIVSYPVTVSNNGQATLNWSALPQSFPTYPPWIEVFPLSGIVEPGEEMVFELTVRGDLLSQSLDDPFYDVIYFTSNAPNPQPYLEVSSWVTGSLYVEWTMDVVDFGDTPLQDTKIAGIGITNLTDSQISITNIDVTYGSGFDIPYMFSAQLQPGETYILHPYFTPTQTIDYSATLSLTYYINNLGLWGGHNIPLIGTGAPGQPVNLTSTIEESTVTLNWLPPGSIPGQMFQGQGEFFDTYYGNPGEYAHRFTEMDLASYSGNKLDAVGFYTESVGNFTVRVYTGENGDELIAEAEATNVTANAWNDIELPEPVYLDMYQDIYLAVDYSNNSYEYFLGRDAGPAVYGKGDLVRGYDGWVSAANWANDFNWTIRGLISPINLPEGNNEPENNTRILKGGDNFGLMGFNIYRDGELVNQQFADDLDYSEEIILGDTIVYGVSAVYDYGEGEPVTVPVFVPLPVNLPSGWEYNSTQMAHNIHIHTDLMQYGLYLQPGDMIGAFYNDGMEIKCAGAGMWTGENMVITIFGNNPVTPEKDGFDPGESIQWKAYIDQGTVEADLVATYSEAMPQYDGTFAMLGLSMLESIQSTTVSVNEISDENQLFAYPNPNNGEFSISLRTDNADPVQVEIFNSMGALVYQNSMDFGSTQLNINIQELPSGVYQLVATQNNSRMVEQIMIK